jgi:hypothetical protein
MFDVSLPWANFWYDAFNAMLFLGAFAVAVGTYGSIKMGAIKERFSDERTTALETQTEQAKAALGVAQADIAKATAQTREAELKLEQLRVLAGPRGLNHEIFAKEIAGKPKAPVEIWYLPDASDSWQFAFHLEVALHEAGWQIGRPIPIPEPPPTVPWRDMPRAIVAGGQPAGITVIGSNIAEIDGDPALKALFEALAKSTNFGMYGSGGSQALPVPKGTLRVVIAAKTDPMFGATSPPDAPVQPK